MDSIRKVISEMEERRKSAPAKAVRGRESPCPRYRVGHHLWDYPGSHRFVQSRRLLSPETFRNLCKDFPVQPRTLLPVTSGWNCSSDGRQDEVGDLTRTFKRMIESLQGMAGVAEQIAAAT